MLAEPMPAPAPAPAVRTNDLDADGILDAEDRCPDEPEDRDQFEDDDGCVDRDNDSDGILDAHEFLKSEGRWTNCDYRPEDNVDVDCRNLPEDFDHFEDHDGCPDLIHIDSCPLKIADRIPLDRQGRLSVAAPKLLDEAAAWMRAAPNTRFWIEAHIDRQQDPRSAKRITQRAADAVIEALVLRGITRDRLEPVAFGDERPGEPNKTAAARARNHRVEFTLRSCWQTSDPRPPNNTPETHECR